ncbi:enoyl-CoA hydratase [Zooshikella marina]|uniref:enoyl-CoA hydratase n=1 Tax=Zooshikella ganghwensis TaxID=202772 RepID=UPI001BB01084|nr:enoyl-CoA hydratase [Zooshikella ganghwensis]MBU2705532.1 enoyl-CoA hydratase [Zooshikella ganghwensis]
MSEVLVEQENGCLILQINRPEKKNALTHSMYTQLTEAILAADEDDSIKNLLITGSGTCFTSGNDINDFMLNPPKDSDSPVFQFLQALANLKKPLIAAVNGNAVGIGTTLLLHCDLVYVGQNAIFQLPFVNLGLCPEAASSYLLPLLAGHRLAAELLLLGQPFDCYKAKEAGLTTQIVEDPSQTLVIAKQAALQLSKQPTQAILLTKQLMKQSIKSTVQDVMQQEGKLFTERLKSPEAHAAFSAFFKKTSQPK